MRKILKNKKGAGDMNMAVIIAVIVGILVVAIIAVKVGPTIVEKVKDIFPEFGVQEEGSSEFSPDASNQPSELQGEDKCIGLIFIGLILMEKNFLEKLSLEKCILQ